MKNNIFPKIFIAGETGMVGSAIKNELKKNTIVLIVAEAHLISLIKKKL